MKSFFITILILLSMHFVNGQGKAKDSCCVSKLRETEIQNASINDLSKEYKRLKSLKSKCCDKWNSDLHQIISRLAIMLGKEGTSIQMIKKYMGKPDADAKNLPYAIMKLQQNEKLLIYYWRGFHDFVYFVYSSNKVKYSKWYNAWE